MKCRWVESVRTPTDLVFLTHLKSNAFSRRTGIIGICPLLGVHLSPYWSGIRPSGQSCVRSLERWEIDQAKQNFGLLHFTALCFGSSGHAKSHRKRRFSSHMFIAKLNRICTLGAHVVITHVAHFARARALIAWRTAAMSGPAGTLAACAASRYYIAYTHCFPHCNLLMGGGLSRTSARNRSSLQAFAPAASPGISHCYIA